MNESGGGSFNPPTGRTIALLGFIVVGLLALFQSISFYVDALWFESLGFESVYWYRIQAQGIVFLVSAAASTLMIRALLWMVAPPSNAEWNPLVIQLGRETVAFPANLTIKRLAWPISLVIGVMMGLSFSSNWTSYALYLNQPETPGMTDPIFGAPLSFYFFTLPVLEAVAVWLLTIAVIGLVAGLLFSATDTSMRFRGVSVGLAFLLCALAFQTYVSRFGFLLADHSLFSGVRYVDHSVAIPGLWFVIAALLIGAGLATANIRFPRVRTLLAAVAAPAVTYAIAVVLVPGYVSTFIVRPNELVRETPYIANNIEFTRKAFGLDRVKEVPFEPRLTNATFDAVQHQDTLDSVRLWDWRALQSTLRQIQEIRTYYDFPDIDVDRYVIDGKRQSMMLAVRELSLNKLPSGSRNWINERLIYTHGYGLTMSPVSQFTREGLPQLVLSNMPVQSSSPGVSVTRPEIYFGEITDWPVYVKTRQKEFNYPEGDANNYTTYEGTGGIRMGSLFRRLILASSVGDLMRVPFSDDITPDSALLMRRNIRDRASELAPFLVFDSDPYVVVGEDGRIYWMMDAFTVSDHYPYSRPLANPQVNYIRNSVKTVIDAYDGTVRFYVFDTEDPILQAYRNMLPQLFVDKSEMPQFLKDHVRYPELLFQIQAVVYSTYHVQNEQVFYNREDIWTIAQQDQAQTGQQPRSSIEPFYVLMKFPGEAELEFVPILPFTPSNRNNLIGWMAGRSDGDAYGELRAYHFPKTRFVDGPLQIQARIDQDPQLSSQLTLWNQQGSTVLRGNLLVLPLEDTLLFAEPIYLQAERSPMPELRLVVLITQDRLAYGSRFPEALNNLLKTQTDLPLSSVTTSIQTTTELLRPGSAPGTPPASVRALVEKANQSLADYRRYTAEGKHAEAGQRLDDLRQTLDQLNQLP